MHFRRSTENPELRERMQLEGSFGGIRFPHVEGFDSLSFKDYLLSQIIFVDN
jgi:hypothetical protein